MADSASTSAVAGPTVVQLAQHVIDSLEAHLTQVVQHAKTASPGATKAIVDFGDAVLDKLEEWGVEARSGIESLRAQLDAAAASNAVPAAAAPSASAPAAGGGTSSG